MLVNGIQADSVSARDRGLTYGDGVFRTFPLRAGKPLMWRRQYAKLAHDCRALRIDCPAAPVLEGDLALIAANQPECVVKIIVTRGDGARGYAIPAQSTPTRIVSASPLPEYPRLFGEQGVRVHLCRIRLAPQPSLAGIKHLNRLENVLARSEWSDPGIVEGLMCDVDDNVISGTMSNLFVFRAGTLFTPQLAHCGVSGVMRDLVIELAREHAIPLEITAIGIDELLAAGELFLVNSVIGLWPVAALDRKVWTAGAISAQFRHWLVDAQDR